MKSKTTFPPDGSKAVVDLIDTMHVSVPSVIEKHLPQVQVENHSAILN